ncbi:MAG TPA: glycosyltransferase family 2 protein [Nocardioidaceae bacterium]|nr:glycosyltransferase family 2 protein [Nocardioidaceae bacterium]
MQALCDVILPCRDEAAALPAVLSQVPETCRALVVDNGSVDGTGQVAALGGARVIYEPCAGYGAAVQAGVEAASAEYVAVLDGDGSIDPRAVLPLLDLVMTGQATMAVGRRRPVGRDSWPWHARIGNHLLVWWLRRHTGLRVRDMAPIRVCRRDDLLALGVQDRRFGYPAELLVRAQRQGWSIVERDGDSGRRAAGTRSKVSGTVTGTVLAAFDMGRVLS